MRASSSLYYDHQDRELLLMVNRVLERDRSMGDKGRLFAEGLHPHGIEELAVSHELRVAYSVINLLESLEAGAVADRILALRSLHEEVRYSAASEFRRNTARVLIQIMKDLIRAYGDPERQIMLARDFRTTTRGNPRVVRSMLQRYHLLEMPEAWDQLTFDNHVHDANTKGRKTPTHLIMDAWIKGIRALTVIYYNFVEPLAVQELMQAAEIMGISIRIGVEYKAVFRGRYVEFIWEPFRSDSFSTIQAMLEESPIKDLMEDGRRASAYSARYVYAMLERYNEKHIHEFCAMLDIELPPISREDLTRFIGSGQASLLHLAELVYKNALAAMLARMPALQQRYEHAADAAEKERIGALVHSMRSLHPESIMETWFTPQRNAELGDPNDPEACADAPDFLRLTPMQLINRLTSIRLKSNITLTLSGLTPADVLELLYVCEGRITHLELFNLKDYAAGHMPYCKEINSLQLAINQGSAVALKRQIRIILQSCQSASPESAERCAAITDILRHMSKLQSYYSQTALRTRIGSDSTSRSYRLFGMGFAFIDSLAPSAIKKISDPKSFQHKIIPLRAQVDSCYTYSVPKTRIKETFLTTLLRKIPGLHTLAYTRKHDWQVRMPTFRYSEKHGTIATMGGFQRQEHSELTLVPHKERRPKPDFSYLNTRFANLLKVLAGFALAACTFLYTQPWWFLAYFGPLIWFTITGLRNIVQAVLGGGGIRRTPLLRWNDYVNWTRICDSLLYTGISVPLLELCLRHLLLNKVFSVNASSAPVIFFTVISAANGVYIASHNIYRGLPTETVVGNLFRSILAIPISLLYNMILIRLVTLVGMEGGILLLQQGAAIISKAASDTVAGIIEGFGDQAQNMRRRYWDYTDKLHKLFACFAQLEVLLPEEDVLELLRKPKGLSHSNNMDVAALKKNILIHSLDLMYFWMYQPRARTMLQHLVNGMSKEERVILSRTQLVLNSQREVSQLFVDGIVGNNFPKPLAFFLDCHQTYLNDIRKLTGDAQSQDMAGQTMDAPA